MVNYRIYVMVLLTGLGINSNAKTQGFRYDGYADSLEKAMSKSADANQRIDAGIRLAKVYYYSGRNDTTYMDVMNEAIAIAKKEKLVKQEAGTRYWKAFFAFGGGSPDGVVQIRQSLDFARSNKIKDTEADALTLLARAVSENIDSSMLLLRQAISISEQNSFTLPKANALICKGALLLPGNSDSARLFMSQGLAISDQPSFADERFILFRNVIRAWLSINADSARFYALKLVEHCRVHGLGSEELISLQQLSFSQSSIFMADSLDNFYARIRLLCRQYKRDSVLYMNRYVQTSQDIGNNNAALRTGFEVLRICEQRNDSAQLIQIYYGLGLSYEYAFDYKNSVIYFHKAMPFKKWDEFIYLFILDDLSRSHQLAGNYDSARYYARIAYANATSYYKSEDQIFGGLLNDLGNIYFEMGDDSIALDYLRRSYNYYNRGINFEGKNFTFTTNALARYFQKHNQPDSVRYYASKSLAIATGNGFLENITNTSSLLADYYFQRKMIDSAYYYQSLGYASYKKQYSSETSREYQKLINEEQRRVEAAEFSQKIAAQKFANNLKIYGLLTLLGAAIIIGSIVVRNNRQRRRSYDLLKTQKQEIDLKNSKLEETLQELNTTQKQLIQSEKMASLGELTAGIAHEIQNPLNFVNNFSEVNNELIEELKNQKSKLKSEEQEELLNDIFQNNEKINHHGKRADAIVKGMLQHSRTSTDQKELTDLNALCDEYLRLSYHGLRAKDKSFNAILKTDFDETIGKINIIPQDIGRVIMNLLTNAFYAVNEKKKSGSERYEPTVSLSTKQKNRSVEIKVADNGNGIPQNIIDKIFQPFFTTKPTGQGTGLGLSLAYDIVKAHGGELKVETKEGEESGFVIELPIA